MAARERYCLDTLAAAAVGQAEDQRSRASTITPEGATLPRGVDATYLHMTGMLVPANPVNNGHYHGLTAQLDDVERPDGTIEAIRAAWGANTPLSQLPFAVRTDLMTVRPLDRWGDRDEGRLEATKPRGGNQYTFTLGGDAGDAERDYFRQNEPNTSHIVPD
jgi:hypothetical protein